MTRTLMNMNNTQAVVLAMLRAGPSNTPRLYSAIEDQLGEFYNATRSAVFKEMSNVVHAGWVRSRGLDYVLTAEGHTQFEKWLAQPPEMDLVRSTTLLRLFLAGSMDPERRKTFIETARNDYTERLRDARAVRKALASDPYGRAVASFIEDRLQALVTLLDSIQEMEPAPTKEITK